MRIEEEIVRDKSSRELFRHALLVASPEHLTPLQKYLLNGIHFDSKLDAIAAEYEFRRSLCCSHGLLVAIIKDAHQVGVE
jgi:hypothetical protein